MKKFLAVLGLCLFAGASYAGADIESDGTGNSGDGPIYRVLTDAEKQTFDPAVDEVSFVLKVYQKYRVRCGAEDGQIHFTTVYAAFNHTFVPAGPYSFGEYLLQDTYADTVVDPAPVVGGACTLSNGNPDLVTRVIRERIKASEDKKEVLIFTLYAIPRDVEVNVSSNYRLKDISQ